MTDTTYIMEYMRAVYGDYAEHAMASFNEQKALVDGAGKIRDMEAEIAKLKSELDQLRAKEVTP